MTTPAGAEDTTHPDARDDAACWQEAARLRQDHSGWVIIWLAPAREYRAYKRLRGARRDTALAAATPSALTAAITQAEQQVPQVRRQRRGQL
jgi:hypothetical protein